VKNGKEKHSLMTSGKTAITYKQSIACMESKYFKSSNCQIFVFVAVILAHNLPISVCLEIWLFSHKHLKVITYMIRFHTSNDLATAKPKGMMFEAIIFLHQCSMDA
jgi:hypothetical protein